MKKNLIPVNTTRRRFLEKSSAATFGFTALPSYLALGKPDADGNVPPSRRINLGCIGAGGRANGVIPGICAKGFAKPVAFCDVDSKHLTAGKNIEAFPEAKTFADFRVMLDKMGDDIDAVTVCTPDHTHFVATLAAMQRGKHVYVEKPLTHSYREADLLMQAEQKYGVVTQMGNQGHTSAGSEQFKHLVARGIVRDIVKIEAWKSPGLWFMKADRRIREYPPEEPKPDTLDWDLWCGPAEAKPFSQLYHPFNWRGFYLYGNGMLGDWGAHIIDFAHDFLKLGLPVKIDCLEMADHNRVIFPLVTRLAMHFPARDEGLPACDLIWHDGDGFEPAMEEKYWDRDDKGKKEPPKLGGAGTLLHRRDGAFLVQRGSHSSASRIFPREKMMEYQEDIKAPNPEFDHAQAFAQACLGNATTGSPFRIAAPLTKVLLLGVICQYLKENLEFDPTTESFPGNAEANRLLAGPPPRKDWEEYYRDI